MKEEIIFIIKTQPHSNDLEIITGECRAQLLDHVLELVVAGLLAVGARAVRGRLPDVHREHNDLGRHGRHLVGEAVLVHAVHVRRERVLAVRLALTLEKQRKRGQHWCFGLF